MYYTDVYEVRLDRRAYKDLKKVPTHVAIKLQAWVEDVTVRGLSRVRLTPGYHDEALKGRRAGQRSIRLSKSYRAIYTIGKNGAITFIAVNEVNKHEY